MALYYKYFVIFMVINFMDVIQKTHSQTVWLDVDTGKIVGVSPPKGTRYQPQQYPQQNYGPYRRHDYNGNQNIHHGMRHPPQTGNNYIRDDPRFGRTLTTEWVCRSSKTGDTMVIDNEIMVSKFPEQLQPNYNHQQQYDQNPWLNNPNNNDHNNNNNNNYDYQKQPQTTTQRNWSIDRNSVTDNYNPTITPKLTTTSQPETLPPIILTTKQPFPSLDNIDWTKYIDATTKAGGSTPSSLNRAVNGEGIISPRSATFD